MIYLKKMKKQLKHNIQVYESGLIVNPTFSYLGASPDGKVVDKSVDVPYGLLDTNVHLSTEASVLHRQLMKLISVWKKYGDTLRLKRDHIYFYQIQGQMAIAGLTWCDFVVYTLMGMYVERVSFDSSLWKDNMFPKLSDFYYKFGIQYILAPCAKS